MKNKIIFIVTLYFFLFSCVEKLEKTKYTNQINTIDNGISLLVLGTVQDTGSLYNGEELNTRDISQISHPFVIETTALFEMLPMSEKKKVHFINFNHTKALLNLDSEQAKTVLKKGFNIPQFNQQFEL